MQRQLGYDSIKAILQHLDANKRFELACVSSFLRTPDRSTPLSIDTLVFNNMELKVNGTSYKIGLIRQNKNGPTPASIKSTNDMGGLQTDLDEFGFEDRSSEIELTPGDVSLSKMTEEELEFMERRREERFDLMEMNLEASEARLEGFTGDSRELRDLKKNISRLRESLEPFYNKRDNRPSPYKMLIQLTSTDENGTNVLEQIPYFMKLHGAMKGMTTTLFGKRRHPIRVRYMEITPQPQILRLPENVKFEVEELKIGREVKSTIEALTSILHTPRLDTLNCLTIMEEDVELLNALVSRKFVTTDVAINEQWLPIFTNLRIKEVVVKNDSMGLTVESYIDLVRHWIDFGKELGTIFSFGILVENTMEEIKSAISEEFGGFVIQMRNGLTLEVSFEETTFEEQIEFDVSPYNFKLEVVL